MSCLVLFEISGCIPKYSPNIYIYIYIYIYILIYIERERNIRALCFCKSMPKR